MTESELREHLKKKMTDVSLDSLRDFIDDALAQGEDYGTICVAIGAIAAAAAKAADRSPSGGITGFQAGAVFWEFESHWNPSLSDGPKRLVCYANMLYPQYADAFANTIPQRTWDWLQEEAKKLLGETGSETVAGGVESHWQAIASGVVPFGYTVKE